MVPINRFTLEQHSGPYESWPLKSRLFFDGQSTTVMLPGYVLLHQFETPRGYILVTDCDCPFEEYTSFALLDRNLRLISCRWLGWPNSTFLLERIHWLDETRFVAIFFGDLRVEFTIRPRGIPYLRPRLKMQRLPFELAADPNAATPTHLD
jgi:hypothetical protein